MDDAIDVFNSDVLINEANNHHTIKIKPIRDEPRYPLGMSSFGQTSKIKREQFGRNVRLAMGCIEAPSEPIKGKAIPSDKASIRARLKTLSKEMTSQHADLLTLLVKFDDLQGWKDSGASHCAAWMNLEIGISLQLSWEYLRVGRKLQLLPILQALFRAGSLSWSKVRLISRVANKENEALLCHAALDTSVSQVKRLCDEYRWGEYRWGENEDSEQATKDENERALQQWDSRSLTWNETSTGSTNIQLVLPPDLAQAFLNSVEHSLNKLENTDANMAQRRADSAILMAESSLQSAGRAIATADRYQVIVSVDAEELSVAHTNHRSGDKSNFTATYQNNQKIIPPKRATVKGANSIARETARRISCDCSLSIIKKVNGEPVDIGRKSRIWPHAMERAIKERDRHCVWPGCTQSRHLHIHHIKHWADGGPTSVENGACLCSHHHTLVHEGGYSLQRIDNNGQRLKEQFARQQCTDNNSMFAFESVLRNSRDSFNAVRMLSPTHFRFRIIDVQGKDAQGKNSLDKPNSSCDCKEMRPTHRPHHSIQASQASHSSRVTQVHDSTHV